MVRIRDVIAVKQRGIGNSYQADGQKNAAAYDGRLEPRFRSEAGQLTLEPGASSSTELLDFQ
ncbi:MAG: hypothetical protein WDN27_04825 [Candidatus Saccharibacteria bacterium]